MLQSYHTRPNLVDPRLAISSCFKSLIKNANTAFLLIPLTIFSNTLAAATINVDNPDDTGTSCTLREAIANTNAGTDQSNGCIVNGSLAAENSITFSVSSVSLSLGEIAISDIVNINLGGSRVNITAANDSRIFSVASENQSVIFDNLMLSGGRAALNARGGAINIDESNVEIRNSVIDDNRAGFGGGINADNNSVLTISNSQVSNNQASTTTGRGGGGIRSNGSSLTVQSSVISGNTSTRDGGGIVSDNSTFTQVISSSIINNTAQRFGGGVAAFGENLTLSNSTISGNTVPGTGNVGAAAFFSGAPVTLVLNTTITNNLSNGNLAAVFYESGGTNPEIRFINTILAGNSDPSGSGEFAADGGSAITDGNNIFGDISVTFAQAFSSSRNLPIGASDILATSDGTSPTPLSGIISNLANNNSNLQTHALPANSPAINSGNNTECVSRGISQDQRGIERDATCDVGAFEFVANEDACFVVPTNNDNTVVFCL